MKRVHYILLMMAYFYFPGCASHLSIHEKTTEEITKRTEEEYEEELTSDITNLLESEEIARKAEEAVPLEDRFDIPVSLNDKVEFFINYFKNEGREIFKIYLERSSRYIRLMKQIFKENNLPEDLVYMALIESGFNPYAFSRARAAGPWQFVKGTAKKYGLRVDFWVDERRDPIKSTIAAAQYLKDLYDLFGHWYLAAAGYNAGERKIIRALEKTGERDFWKISESKYLKRETKEYVPKLLAAAIIAKNPEKYGFTDLNHHSEFSFEVVKVQGAIDLEVFARACGLDVKEIRDLNPALRRWFTPPDESGWELRVPPGKKEDCEKGLKKVPRKNWIEFKTYRIEKGDTLWQIAYRFDISPWEIERLNNLRARNLRPGETILIPVRPDVQPKKIYHGKGRKLYRREFAYSKNATFYTVKPGDTLWDISARFGVSVKDIKKWNMIPKKNLIKPEDTIIIVLEEEK